MRNLEEQREALSDILNFLGPIKSRGSFQACQTEILKEGHFKHSVLSRIIISNSTATTVIFLA